MLLFLACTATVATVDSDEPPIEQGSDSGATDSGPGDSGGDSGPGDSGGDSGPADTSPPDDTSPPVVEAPDYGEPGPWSAGHLAAETPNAAGDPLYLQVWYPTDDAGPARVYGWEGYEFEGTAAADATPACDEPRPVMVHSHGNNSIAWEMFWWQERASTHGWITAATDHPGNTFYDYTHSFSELLVQRPSDVQDVFDWLVAASGDASSPLFGCVDADAGYVATGWSFGGYTAYVTAGALANSAKGEATADRSDDRVTAVVTFAPWDGAENLTGGTAALDVPVLTAGADRDATVGTQYLALFDPIEVVPRAQASFANAGHLSYTPIYCTLAGDGCGPLFQDSDTFTAELGLATLAWLGHVRGESGAIEQLPEADDDLSWELVLE